MLTNKPTLIVICALICAAGILGVTNSLQQQTQHQELERAEFNHKLEVIQARDKVYQEGQQALARQAEDFKVQLAIARAQGTEEAKEEGYKEAVWDIYFRKPKFVIQESMDGKEVAIWKKLVEDPRGQEAIVLLSSEEAKKNKKK